MISVILGAQEDGPALRKCLASLERQDSSTPLEIIVAGLWGEAAQAVTAAYARARVLPFPKTLSKAELLKEALTEARGEVVAVTEASCWFPPGWVETLYRAHGSEFDVIGGAVEYGGEDSPAGWACFLADYGPFLKPEPRRLSGPLAGNHISYKRRALDEASDSWRHGYVKPFLLWEMERRGMRFLFDPALVVFCAPENRPRPFARSYYENAREFASRRAESFSATRRVTHIAGTPLLPFLLLLRRARAVWGKREQRGRLLRAIPLLAMFVVCWSAGELMGYLQAGKSD